MHRLFSTAAHCKVRQRKGKCYSAYSPIPLRSSNVQPPDLRLHLCRWRECSDLDLLVPAEIYLLISQEFGTLYRTSLESSLALYVNLHAAKLWNYFRLLDIPTLFLADPEGWPRTMNVSSWGVGWLAESLTHHCWHMHKWWCAVGGGINLNNEQWNKVRIAGNSLASK